jgi:flagellar biosynthesis protein FlhB
LAKKVRFLPQEADKDSSCLEPPLQTSTIGKEEGRVVHVEETMQPNRHFEKMSVVVTDNFWVSVVVMYDPEVMTPVIVMRATGRYAAAVAMLWKTHRVVVHCDPELAWSLFREVGLGEEVPESFWGPPVLIFTYIHRNSKAPQ